MQDDDKRQSRLKPADKIAFLRNHPIFGALGPGLLEQIASYAIPTAYARGKTVFSKGDRGSSLFAVMEGTVKISAPSSQGKSAVLNHIHAGEIFGEIALFDGGERTADATALTDCRLLVLDRRDFLPLVRANPDLAIKIIQVLCSRLRHTTEQVEDVVFLSLPSRLARVLMKLAPGELPGKRIPITQLEISQMIGASRESTNKQLREWEESKWIKIERGGIVMLAPAAISAVLDE